MTFGVKLFALGKIFRMYMVISVITISIAELHHIICKFSHIYTNCVYSASVSSTGIMTLTNPMMQGETSL